MAKKYMLDDGVTSHGAMHRGYDKYGKRRHMADDKRDMSMKDKRIARPRAAGTSKGVDSNTKRRDVGIK